MRSRRQVLTTGAMRGNDADFPYDVRCTGAVRALRTSLLALRTAVTVMQRIAGPMQPAVWVHPVVGTRLRLDFGNVRNREAFMRVLLTTMCALLAALLCAPAQPNEPTVS